MIFLTGLMIIGLAVLAGGQVWLETGLTYLAWGTGIVVFSFLVWLARKWNQIKSNPRFLGEIQERLNEDEFRTLISGRDTSRDEIKKKARQHSAKTANSIRSILKVAKSEK